MKNQIITVNSTEIQIVTFDGERYVAIKPICEAIGVNYTTQLEKIQDDEILSSVVPLRGITAADNKEYKMRVIPLRFVFGWLFTINPNNVKPEIKQNVLNYRMQCYNSLFDTFTKRTEILKEKTTYQLEIDKLEAQWKESEEYEKIQELKQKQKNASQRLNNLDKDFVADQLELFDKDQLH
jgi:hypothetical protein